MVLPQGIKELLLYFLLKKKERTNINQLRIIHATTAVAQCSTIKTNQNSSCITDVLIVPHFSTEEKGLQCLAEFVVRSNLW